MKDAEPTIERLLAGLRDAEPQPGIEHRIFAAMQARETVAFVSFWSRLRPQTLPAFAIWLAGTLAITGAFVAAALHQRSRAPADSSHPPTLAVQEKSPAEAIAQKAPVPARPLASRVWSKHSRPVIPVPNLRAAGFPAPPLPLTEQEKLLQRLARRRNPEDTAILNPDAQAAQSAKANEQFQQFFGINSTEMRKQIE
jgi:hypothetical protein